MDDDGEEEEENKVGCAFIFNRNTLMMMKVPSSFRVIEIPCTATEAEAREKPASSITMQIFHGAFLSSNQK